MSLPPLNPWISIWTQPRATMRQILDTDPNARIWLLAAIGGVSHALSSASQSGAIETMGLGVLIASSIVVGALVGIVGLWVGAYLVKWTGGWIGGQGSLVEVRSALAWSNVPAAWGLILWGLTIVLFGDAAFSDAGPDFETLGGMAVLMLSIVVTALVLEIWQIVIALKCIGEAHGFSAWKALASMLLIAGLILGSTLVLALVAGLLHR